MVFIAIGGLFVLGVGGCLALVASAGNVIDEGIQSAAVERSAETALVEDSAAVTSCEIGDFGIAVATVEFTNPLDEEKGFISIEVNFIRDDVVVGSGSAIFQNLSPGQKAIGEARAVNVPETATDGSTVTCDVADSVVL